MHELSIQGSTPVDQLAFLMRYALFLNDDFRMYYQARMMNDQSLIGSLESQYGHFSSIYEDVETERHFVDGKISIKPSLSMNEYFRYFAHYNTEANGMIRVKDYSGQVFYQDGDEPSKVPTLNIRIPLNNKKSNVKSTLSEMIDKLFRNTEFAKKYEKSAKYRIVGKINSVRVQTVARTLVIYSMYKNNKDIDRSNPRKSIAEFLASEPEDIVFEGETILYASKFMDQLRFLLSVYWDQWQLESAADYRGAVKYSIDRDISNGESIVKNVIERVFPVY